MCANKTANDIDSNDTCDTQAASSCVAYTVHLQPQNDLEILGMGACGQVYHISDHVVLKTCQIYAPPENASQSDLWHYASETLFHFNLLKNERTVLQLLQKRPHPHIIKAIDTHRPEGLYLYKYQQLPVEVKSSQSRRIRLYRDIADALSHLHSLGVVHGDLRVDNVLCDDRFSTILCDFSAACPLGDPNLVFPDLPLPVNGPSPTLSEATDMFALASLMYHLEHGVAIKLSLENGELKIPELNSGNECIDEIIRTAWLGNYKSTSDMVHQLSLIDAQVNDLPKSTDPSPPLNLECLETEVMDWRSQRKDKYGAWPR